MQRKRGRPNSPAELAHLTRLREHRSEATRPAIGSQFGTLTVIGYAAVKGKLRATVRCTCGIEKAIMIQHVRRTKSCGCLTNSIISKARTRHGMTDSPAWLTWKNMLDRCRNKSCASWENYGGRGIEVCKRWEIFENFYADMGERVGELTIERIDNEGNYEPGNCRWATHKQNMRNTRSNRKIEYQGESHTAGEWSGIMGINERTIKGRLRAGWNAEKALTTPVKKILKIYK